MTTPDHTRQVALDAFREIQKAAREIVEVFDAQQGVAEAFIGILEGPEPITDLVSGFGVSTQRDRLQSALHNYETCRREARLAVWRLLLAEGNSIGEVGRIFGLSRQLVSRQLRDYPEPESHEDVE